VPQVVKCIKHKEMGDACPCSPIIGNLWVKTDASKKKNKSIVDIIDTTEYIPITVCPSVFSVHCSFSVCQVFTTVTSR